MCVLCACHLCACVRARACLHSLSPSLSFFRSFFLVLSLSSPSLLSHFSPSLPLPLPLSLSLLSLSRSLARSLSRSLTRSLARSLDLAFALLRGAPCRQRDPAPSFYSGRAAVRAAELTSIPARRPADRSDGPPKLTSVLAGRARRGALLLFGGDCSMAVEPPWREARRRAAAGARSGRSQAAAGVCAARECSGAPERAPGAPSNDRKGLKFRSGYCAFNLYCRIAG